MVNEWTSNDVPSVSSLDLYNKRPELDLGGKQFGAVVAFEAMVKHLNAHYPKPENPEQLLRMCNEADLKRTRAEADADRWRRAHEIVEGERDLARERLREVDSALAKCMSDYQDVEDERDEARAGRVHYRDSLGATVTERDEWRARAEAAEARTAVTREDVEKVVHGSGGGFFDSRLDAITDAVCDLLGVKAGQVTDPVEARAEELWDVAHPPIPGNGGSWRDLWRRATDAERHRYRLLARHVLGQEAGDE